MVQHADRLDDVEAPIERSKPENIGLAVFDIGQAQGAGFPAGVSQAGAADVDRQDARFRKSQRAIDRM